eukprot:gene8464-10396_t
MFKIEKGAIPNSVKLLTILVENYLSIQNMIQVGSIPSSVVKLSVEHQLVKHNPHHLIPPSVVHLELFDWYSQKGETDFIPSSVRKLIIYTKRPDVYFSKGCIPPTVTKLEMFFSKSPLNQFELGFFPTSITKLKLVLFNGPPIQIDVPTIPDSVTSLELTDVQLSAPGSLPNHLKSLKLICQAFVFGPIPSSLTKLVIQEKIQGPCILPETLTHLDTFEKVAPETKLPTGLKYLRCRYNSIGNGLLPFGLETLILCSVITHIEVGSIPNSVIEIVLDKILEIDLGPGVLPQSLLEFRLNGISEETKFPVLPPNLMKLVINSINELISIPVGAIPESCIDLEFEIHSKIQPFKQGVLPSKIKSLLPLQILLFSIIQK